MTSPWAGPASASSRGAAGASRAFVMVGLLSSLLASAGCLGSAPTDSPAVGLRLSGHDACDPDVVANCGDVARDSNQPYVLVPQQLRNQVTTDEETVGVSIDNISRGVVIRGFSIDAFDIGVRVDNVSCSSCEIVVERTSITGGLPKTVQTKLLDADDPSSGVYDFKTAYGIELRTDGARVRFSDLVVRMAGGGEFQEAEHGSYWFYGGSIGLGLGTNSTAHLSNVTVVSEPYSVRNGISFGGLSADIDMRDVRVAGFAFDVKGFAREATFDGLILSDARNAMEIAILRSFALSRFVARNTTWGINAYAYSPDDLAGPSTPLAAEVRDGLVEGNAVWGLRLSALQVNARNVTFLRNGQQWETGGIPEDEAGGFVLYNSPATVRASYFSGNVPFGLATPGNGLAVKVAGGGTVDARENWWGSPTGPRAQGAQNMPITPGQGDAVGEGVVFAPFLTAPPP